MRAPSQREVLLAVGAAAAGWAALFLEGYLLERPLLWVVEKTAGASWAQPLSVVADFGAFFGAGWVAGRLARRPGVGVFLVSLLFYDWNPLFPLHFGWVLREIQNTLRDSRYLEGLLQAVLMNGMYLVAVWVGGMQGIPRERISIVGTR